MGRRRGNKKAQVACQKSTPYQGKNRSFGLYECLDCNRQWASSNSWANTYQQCNTCYAEVLPHKQWPPKKGRRVRKRGKRHPQNLCQKCQQLGFYCRELDDPDFI